VGEQTSDKSKPTRKPATAYPDLDGALANGDGHQPDVLKTPENGRKGRQRMPPAGGFWRFADARCLLSTASTVASFTTSCLGEFMLFVSSAVANQNVRGLLMAVENGGHLSKFATTVYWNGSGLINRILPKRIATQMNRRAFIAIPQHKIVSHPLPEMIRVAKFRLASHAPRWMDFKVGNLVNEMYTNHDDFASKQLMRTKGVSAVWAYAGSARETLRAAKSSGLTTFLEMSRAHYSLFASIAEEERAHSNEWAPTISRLYGTELSARDNEELSLADHIIVPSHFVRDSIPCAKDRKRSIIIPYGTPDPVEVVRVSSYPILKVLFVGGLSQLKGLSYLFSAMRSVGRRASLTVVGLKATRGCAALEDELARHTWYPTLSNSNLLHLMGEHDVLVLPSLLEGQALVVGEALSRGVVPIVTPNCGWADATLQPAGYIVPIRNAEAIAAKIEALAADRSLLRERSVAALEIARLHSWQYYRQKILEFLHNG
jgi:starch synthase